MIYIDSFTLEKENENSEENSMKVDAKFKEISIKKCNSRYSSLPPQPQY